MWYKIIFALFIISCNKIETDAFDEPLDLSISLLTPTQQESFSFMKNEFAKVFNIQPSKVKCDLSVSIKHYKQNTGISSTAFAINQTLVFTTLYSFTCNNGWQVSKPITLTNEFTVQQDKTVGQYVGEKYFLQEISKRMAKEIYDEISLFILLQKNDNSKAIKSDLKKTNGQK